MNHPIHCFSDNRIRKPRFPIVDTPDCQKRDFRSTRCNVAVLLSLPVFFSKAKPQNIRDRRGAFNWLFHIRPTRILMPRFRIFDELIRRHLIVLAHRDSRLRKLIQNHYCDLLRNIRDVLDVFSVPAFAYHSGMSGIRVIRFVRSIICIYVHIAGILCGCHSLGRNTADIILPNTSGINRANGICLIPYNDDLIRLRDSLPALMVNQPTQHNCSLFCGLRSNCCTIARGKEYTAEIREASCRRKIIFLLCGTLSSK